jgi:hypothetical protein
MPKRIARQGKNPFPASWPKKGGQRFIGAHVPLEDADFLIMTAIYKTTSVSGLLREALVNYAGTMLFDCEHLENVLAGRAQQEWHKRLERNRGARNWDTSPRILARYREFQQEMKLRLMHRGLSEMKATAVIQQMEVLYGLTGARVDD